MSSRRVVLRDAVDEDVDAITEIQNALLDSTTIEWTEEPHTAVERRRWIEGQRARGLPVLVAQLDDEVVGWAAYGEFRDPVKWPGYRFTVEHTLHVREGHWGAGIGRALMLALMDRARAAGLHAMVAAVDGDNTGSVTFHQRLGFEEVGRLRQIGEKHGRWLDLVLLQALLDSAVAPPRSAQ